ncbi:hypothetical protein HOI71_29765, partial [Candidatus Poribacteria bacterium]|nr:hypothetical protein [Candidatus Poribacteria bacterium]
DLSMLSERRDATLPAILCGALLFVLLAASAVALHEVSPGFTVLLPEEEGAPPMVVRGAIDVVWEAPANGDDKYKLWVTERSEAPRPVATNLPPQTSNGSAFVEWKWETVVDGAPDARFPDGAYRLSFTTAESPDLSTALAEADVVLDNVAPQPLIQPSIVVHTDGDVVSFDLRVADEDPTDDLDWSVLPEYETGIVFANAVGGSLELEPRMVGETTVMVRVTDLLVRDAAGAHRSADVPALIVVNAPPMFTSEAQAVVTAEEGGSISVAITEWIDDVDLASVVVTPSSHSGVSADVTGTSDEGVWTLLVNATDVTLGEDASIAFPVTLQAADAHGREASWALHILIIGDELAGQTDPTLLLVSPGDGDVIASDGVEFLWTVLPKTQLDGEVSVVSEAGIEVAAAATGARRAIGKTSDIDGNGGDGFYGVEVLLTTSDGQPLDTESISLNVDREAPPIALLAGAPSPVVISMASAEHVLKLTEHIAAPAVFWGVRLVGPERAIHVGDVDQTSGEVPITPLDAPIAGSGRHFGKATIEVRASDFRGGALSDAVEIAIETEDEFPQAQMSGERGSPWALFQAALNFRPAMQAYALTVPSTPSAAIGDLFLDKEDSDLDYTWELPTGQGAPGRILAGTLFLTVPAAAQGSATGVLTAKDDAGAFATIVVPIRFNHSPTAAQTTVSAPFDEDKTYVVFDESGPEAKRLSAIVTDVDLDPDNPDAEQLTLALNPPVRDGVVTADLTEGRLIFSADADKSGNAAFDMIVTDSAGHEVVIPIAVAVSPTPDDPERTAEPTTGHVVTAAGPALELSVHDFFTDPDVDPNDPDSDSLVWELAPLDEGLEDVVAFVDSRDSSVGDVLHVRVAKRDTDLEDFTLDLTAKDTQSTTADPDISLSFQVNLPPSRSDGEPGLTLEPLEVDEGGVGWQPYDLTAVIHDSDGDTVTFSAGTVEPSAPFTQAPLNAVLDGAGTALVLSIADIDAYGNGSIEITAGDGSGETTFELPIVVADVNDLPRIVAWTDPVVPPDVIPPSGVIDLGVGSSRTFKLTPHAEDADLNDGIPDNDVALVWSERGLGPDSGVSATISRGTLTLRADSTAQTTSFTLTVSDGQGSASIENIVIKVDLIATVTLPDALPVPGNDALAPRTWSGVPWPSGLLEDAQLAYELDLRPYFDNPDGPGDPIDRWDFEPKPDPDPNSDPLTYTPTAAVPIVFSSTQGGLATLTLLPDWHGTHALTIIAIDGGQTLRGKIDITVESNPEGPEWLPLTAPTIEFREHHWLDDGDTIPTRSLPLALLASDDDQNPEQLDWDPKITGPAGESLDDRLWVRSDGLDLVVGPRGTPVADENASLDWHGTATIELTATDLDGLWVTGSINLVVAETSERPQLLTEHASVERANNGDLQITFDEHVGPDPSLAQPHTIPWGQFIRDDEDGPGTLRDVFAAALPQAVRVLVLTDDPDSVGFVPVKLGSEERDGDWTDPQPIPVDLDGDDMPDERLRVVIVAKAEPPRVHAIGGAAVVPGEATPIDVVEDTQERFVIDVSDDNDRTSVPEPLVWGSIQATGLTAGVFGSHVLTIDPDPDLYTQIDGVDAPIPVTLTVTDTEDKVTETLLRVSIKPVPDPIEFREFEEPEGALEFLQRSSAEHPLLARVTDPDGFESKRSLVWMTVDHQPDELRAEFNPDQPGILTLSSRDPKWFGEGTVTVRVSKEVLQIGADEFDPSAGPGLTVGGPLHDLLLSSRNLDVGASTVIVPAGDRRWTLSGEADDMEIVAVVDGDGAATDEYSVAFFNGGDVPVEAIETNDLPDVSRVVVSEPDAYGSRRVTFTLQD